MLWTPIEVVINVSLNLLNLGFVGIFLGRVASRHVGPPCSSLSWASNQWGRYAMRSFKLPGVILAFAPSSS